MTSVSVRTVNFDCHDAREMARFYGGLLGWEPTVVEPDWVLMRDPQGGTGLSFQQTDGYERPTWPEEPGRQQKMVHLELKVTPPGAEADGGFSPEKMTPTALIMDLGAGSTAHHAPKSMINAVGGWGALLTSSA